MNRVCVTIRGWLLILFLFALGGCGRLDSIEYSPRTTPEQFLNSQPHLRLPLLDLVLIQPSSTIIVYFVSVLTLGVGLYFLRVRRGQQTRLWWGIGLLLSGLGALMAGTSYQAFGYEIKCAGRQFCTWTSYWEVGYLLCSGAGMSAMLVAMGYSCVSGMPRKALFVYAFASAMVYGGAVLTGALVPIRFLVSFEGLLLAATPTIALALFLTVRGSWMYRDRMNLALLKTWVSLVAVMAAYALAVAMEMGPRLWTLGIWFTENDVLHLGMILWILFIAVTLPNRVEDLVPCPRAQEL
jgi:hypothetical protein